MSKTGKCTLKEVGFSKLDYHFLTLSIFVKKIEIVWRPDIILWHDIVKVNEKEKKYLFHKLLLSKKIESMSESGKYAPNKFEYKKSENSKFFLYNKN